MEKKSKKPLQGSQDRGRNNRLGFLENETHALVLSQIISAGVSGIIKAGRIVAHEADDVKQEIWLHAEKHLSDYAWDSNLPLEENARMLQAAFGKDMIDLCNGKSRQVGVQPVCMRTITYVSGSRVFTHTEPGNFVRACAKDDTPEKKAPSGSAAGARMRSLSRDMRHSQVDATRKAGNPLDPGDDLRALRHDYIDDSAPNPLDVANARETARLIHALLVKLPNGVAKYLRGMYFEGMRVAELAEKYNVSEQEVRNSIAKGLRRLRKLGGQKLAQALS